MTIKRLSEYIAKCNVPKLGRRNENDTDESYFLSNLKGYKIAVEVSSILYKQNWAAINNVVERFPFEYAIRSGEIAPSWNRPTIDDIIPMFRIHFRSYVKKILSTGVHPVFILEGDIPPMKKNTSLKRSGMKDAQKDKAHISSQSTSLTEYKKNLLYSYHPSVIHRDVAKEILLEMKQLVVQAHYEGEGVCAALVSLPKDDPYYCSMALVDDYDIFMYGCKAVIRNLRKNMEIEAYAYNDILSSFGLHTDEQFTMLCILSGSDYAENVPNIGIAKVCDLIKKHKINTYDEICEIQPKFRDIPYHDIVKTLSLNRGYDPVY